MTSLIILRTKNPLPPGVDSFFATTITTFHYLATKVLGLQAAFRYIQSLLSLLVIAPVNRVVLENAAT